MKVRSVLLVCVIAVSIFSFSLIGYLFGVSVTRRENISLNPNQVSQKATPVRTDASVIGTPSAQKESDKPSQAETTEMFVLREENGKIALLKRSTDGKERLLSSYDVPIAFLPKSDREKLREGLEFKSMDEIIKFIEDYIG